MLALHKQKILHTLTMQAKDTQKLSPQFCQETTKKNKKKSVDLCRSRQETDRRALRIQKAQPPMRPLSVDEALKTLG